MTEVKDFEILLAKKSFLFVAGQHSATREFFGCIFFAFDRLDKDLDVAIKRPQIKGWDFSDEQVVAIKKVLDFFEDSLERFARIRTVNCIIDGAYEELLVSSDYLPEDEGAVAA